MKSLQRIAQTILALPKGHSYTPEVLGATIHNRAAYEVVLLNLQLTNKIYLYSNYTFTVR